LNKKINPNNLILQQAHTKKIPNMKKNLTAISKLKKNLKRKKRKTKKSPARKKTKNSAVEAPVLIPPVQAVHQTRLPHQTLKMLENEGGIKKSEILEKTAKETDDQSQRAEKKEKNPEKNLDTILDENHDTSAGTQEMTTRAGTRSEATTAAAEAVTTKATADDDCINLN
jgi:hypothetical protein